MFPLGRYLSVRAMYDARKIMGLTVHYRLAAPKDCDAAQAHELVRAMRRHAQGFKQRGCVEKVGAIGTGHESLR
jgi:hypothetical protein